MQRWVYATLVVLGLLALGFAVQTTAQPSYPTVATMCNSGGTWVPCSN